MHFFVTRRIIAKELFTVVIREHSFTVADTGSKMRGSNYRRLHWSSGSKDYTADCPIRKNIDSVSSWIIASNGHQLAIGMLSSPDPWDRFWLRAGAILEWNIGDNIYKEHRTCSGGTLKDNHGSLAIAWKLISLNSVKVVCRQQFFDGDVYAVAGLVIASLYGHNLDEYPT